MENLSQENKNENTINQDSDARILEAVATIYSNWILNEQKKNEVYMSQILKNIQDKICQSETEERKTFVKEQFQRHAETLDSSCRTSIYGVFYILTEAIHGENLKKWAKDFADSFHKAQDKNFLKKKDNYDLRKCFKNFMEMANTEQKASEDSQRQQEEKKGEEKKLAKAQKNKLKRERKKLEKKNSGKVESQEIEEEEGKQ